MQAIKCPACGHLISPHSVLADGKVSCPGCKKTYSFRKKAAPAESAEPEAAEPPAAAASPPAEAAAAAPARSRIPRRSLPGARKPAPVATAEGGDGEVEATGGKKSARSAKAAQKRMMVLLLAGGLVLVLGLFALFVKLQFDAAADAQRVAADQVLQVLALKWLIEAEGVKECEAAWKQFRTEDSRSLAELLGGATARRDLGLRLWLYQHRSEDLRRRISTFLGLLDLDCNQLLYLKGHEMEGRQSIDPEDMALDWLTFRGYQVLENLKKKGAGSITGDAKVDSTTPGGLKMTLFAAGVDVEFNPAQSTIDLNSGSLQVAYQASCPGLNGDGTGAFQVLAAIRENCYLLNLKAEIQEYLTSAGPWWYDTFTKSAGKSPPPAPPDQGDPSAPPAEAR